MTQEERINHLENELSNLKEELRRTRKANIWKKVKDTFTTDFNDFNWTHIHTFTNCEGKEITHKNERNESYHISQAIGTIVRIVLKKKGIVYLEDEDEYKAREITRKILEIMKEERGDINEKKVT